jgi:hypothetical protein
VVIPYHLAMKSETHNKHGLLIYKKHPSMDKSTKKLITECGKSQYNIKMCVDRQLSTRRHNQAISIGTEKKQLYIYLIQWRMSEEFSHNVTNLRK